MQCIFCGTRIERESSHTASPVSKWGNCCTSCNQTIVKPYKIVLAVEGRRSDISFYISYMKTLGREH